MKLTKIFSILTAALLLAWLMPWSYDFIWSKPSGMDLTMYSCVKHDFMTFEFNKDDVAGYDMEGNAYTQKQFDSLMPTLFYYELERDNRLPKEIDGIPFDRHAVEMSNFVFRSAPHQLNRPHTGLYQLYDASLICEAITTPEDLFRITESDIEFVNMARNKVDLKKSQRFTRLMQREGFVFPHRYLNGNTESRKRYDNGYLILDQKGQLFQMKRYRSQPYFRKIDIPDTIRLTHTFVTEFADKRLLGFLRDSLGSMYALETDYTLHRLPIRPFTPETQTLVLTGDMYYWNAIEEGATWERITAINGRDYSYVKEIELHHPRPTWQERQQYFFPFRLKFTSPSEKYVRPHFMDFSYVALLFNLLLAGIYYVIRRRHKQNLWLKTLGVWLFGFYLFIPFLLTDRK